MNVYQTVTDRLVEAMQAGKIPWRQPWKARARGGSLPINHASGKQYRGINIWLLTCAPYSSNSWMTYKQAAERGAHVRKGEHGFPVVFWKFDKERNAETGKFDTSVLIRQYTVFNVEQIEGLPLELPLDLPAFNPIDSAEKIKSDFLSSSNAPHLEHHGAEAFYSPSADKIVMPDPRTFFKPEGYYTTFFHEAGHSTGHTSRCDRKDGMANFFGDHLYSKEELCAEFTAAFLCAECGISNEYTESNSVAYLQSWISKLQSDPKIAVMAAQRAQKAADYILGRSAASVELEGSAEVAA
jgi:antirestriction protein ArdC